MATTCCCSSSSSSSQEECQNIMNDLLAGEGISHIDDLISYIDQSLNKETNIAKTAGAESSINSARMLVDKGLERSKTRLCKSVFKRNLNRETRKLIIDVGNQADKIKWVGVALSIVASVLERVDQVSSNTEESLKLLKYMRDLAKYVKQLDERLAQEKLNRVLQFIIEGSALCISQIESHSFVSKCLAAPVMGEDLQRLQRDLEHQYSDLSLGAIIAVLNGISVVLNRIPVVLPPSQGLAPEAVGTEEASKHVTRLLNMESKSVIAVVIYGQGGIGKTTLATTVFTKVNLQNYKFCRVEMQQDCTDLDLQKLQKQILRDLFQRNIFELRNCTEGRDELSKEFRKATTPLFIFIDNALRESDLKKLLPINHMASLPQQSRILLTTRNLNETRIILQAGIERPYYLVPTLPDPEAHKLLCKFAFGNVHASFDPTIDIEGLLQTCGGVPLVLTLAGARLREHTQSVSPWTVTRWTEEVEILKSELSEGEAGNLSERMVNFVYNRLRDSSKQAFLDIVFFFCNWERDIVVSAIGETELEKVERAALVNITDDRKVEVHDIVQAHGIRLSPYGERIAANQSLHDVLHIEERIKKIKGIAIFGGKIEARHLNLMSRCLRVMIGVSIENGECKGDFENLRCLKLDNKSYSLMDVSKHPRLAVLIVECAKSREFPAVAFPSALKYIKLYCATLANRSTIISQLRNLRVLQLFSCGGFDSLPESIGNLTSLEKLNVRFPVSLASLPESFGKLCSLTSLMLWNCPQLSALPESFGNLASLEVLRLEFCGKLLNLPQNFGQLKRLKYLSISGCSGLKSLSADFEGLSSLIAIDASYCGRLQGDTIDRLVKMKGVMMVDIHESPQLEERWKQVEDQYSLVGARKPHYCDEDYGDTMYRALLQSGLRLVHADENGEHEECCSLDIGREGIAEMCVLLTECDLTRAENRRYLEEVEKKWEEVGGEKKMKVFVDVGVSWEESERRVREMLRERLLPRGSRAWIAADSRARLLYAYSLFKQYNKAATDYQPTVIAGISVPVDSQGPKRMRVDDFIIPDCTPDFEDAHIFDQLFSPLSKAEAFLFQNKTRVYPEDVED